MVNKKGYIKTMEAVIAIIIIVIVSYILIPRSTEPSPEVPSIIKGATKIIDQSIQLNETIRNALMSEELSIIENILKDINHIIKTHNPQGYDYTCAVCSNPGKCVTNIPYDILKDKSIYMIDVFVASSGTQQNPKVVRIWFWKKPTSDKDKRSIVAYNDCTRT